MKNVLYVHGYKGTPDGSTFQYFKKYLNPEEYKVFGLSYSLAEADKAVASIKSVVEKNKIDIVIASSLGAFAALQLVFVSIENHPMLILINPCMAPTVELPKIVDEKSQINIASYENWEQVDIQYEAGASGLTNINFNNVFGFFGIDDELFEERYHEWWKMLTGKPAISINSKHKVSEEGAIMIAKFIENYTG